MFFLQIDPDLNKGAAWAVITVMAGAISALAIYHSKRQKDWETKFEKLSQENKEEVLTLVKQFTETVVGNKFTIEQNTKAFEEQTKLFREMRDKILKIIE